GGSASPIRPNGTADSPYPGSDFSGEILSPILREIETTVSSILDRFTIQDLFNRKRELEQTRNMMFHI
ncbi:MAG TPA: hypothetical protein VLB09_01360, partial [Nitrospiria bacterium]|nr:hypothetical protein [Nitrospiria bacterium]